MDYKINDRWTFFATYRQQKLHYFSTSPGQFDIIPGQTATLSSEPVLPRFATFGLTGAIGSSFTNEVHGDYLIDFWGYDRAAVENPSGITGLGGVLQVSGEGQLGDAGGGFSTGSGKAFADPINFDTQDARSRFWDGRDWYLADDATWLHGTHNITFGGSYYFWNIIHQRDDDVLNGLTNNDIYWVGSKYMSDGSFVDPGDTANEAPPVCTASSSSTALCLNSNDLTRWYDEYASMLGLVAIVRK